MSDATVPGKDPDYLAIAALAQRFSTLMLETVQDDGPLNWQDACFAAAIAMKGLSEMSALMQDRPPADTLQELRTVFDAGLRQEVALKRFKSRAEMEAWNAAQQALGKSDGKVH